MDYVTCGTGSYFDFHQIIPPSLYDQRLGEPFAAALKAVVRHARVQAESHIRTPEAAEAVLAAGHADMVSIVRGQIADPHLVAKARAGRADEVRPCISCNQLCWGRRSRDYWISCLVNPSAGREWEWGGDRFEPAATPRHVLVVGGGPAGLEAARVAAERGHTVTLLERARRPWWSVPARRAPAVAWPDPRPARLVRPPPRGTRRRGPSRRRGRSRGGRGRRRRCRRGGHGVAAATDRVPAGTPTGRSTPRGGRERRVRGAGRARRTRPPRDIASWSSTTSATGAASGPPATSQRTVTT